jgi:hypothetical protein
MIKKISCFLITTLCLSLAACSYDLKHITLDEKSDTGWTEVKKANTPSPAESKKKNEQVSPDSEIHVK